MVAPENFPGRFKVDATSDLAKRVITTGSFEPRITELLKRFSDVDGDVVNIGANIGFYSVFFARQYTNVRKVIAIEPNPEAFSLLLWNVKSNDEGSRIEAICVGIGDEITSMDLAFVPGKTEYSSLGKVVHSAVEGMPQKKVRVEVVPLQKAVENLDFDPSLIFIDTEGAELLVLRGAKDVLERFSPVLVFECEDALLQKFGHSSEMLDDYVNSLGYQVRDASSPEYGLVHPFKGVAVAIPRNEKTRLEEVGAATSP